MADTTNDIDYLSMSDEEIEALEANGEDTVIAEEPTETTEEETEAERTTVDEETTEEEEVETEDEPESHDDVEDETEEKEDTEADVQPETSEDEIDYKQAYEELMKPFKANGAEITINSIEDQRKLLQKGANYELKMQGIKPVKVLQKTLEKAGIITAEGAIDETRLNTLLELDKGNPEAIKAAMKKADIDPLEVDLDELEEFVPENHIPNDKQLAMDEVIKDIETSEAFDTTVDVITNKWDKQSRDFFSERPEALKDLNTDIETGVFDTINNVVQSEKLMGRFNGVSDIDAYIQVAQRQANTPKQEPVNHQGAVDNTAKKKAAGITKSKTKGNSKPAAINPLTLSDEEFEKIYG